MQSVKKLSGKKSCAPKTKPKIELNTKCLNKSPQDFLFVNHINYLNKVLFILDIFFSELIKYFKAIIY